MMKKSKFNVGVIGIGEVGAAIAEVLSEKFYVYKKDLDFDEIKNHKISVLHICFPYNSKFITNTIKEIKSVNPSLVIIHSTLSVGVTRSIAGLISVPVVHSPVRGVHPFLTRDIKKFVKYIGAVDIYSEKLAKKHLSVLGIKVIAMKNPEETELAKLLDTTYYGWNIIFCKQVGELCNKLGLDFENVYTHFNNSYNEGYKKTLPNVIRPVLKYNHQKDIKGGIGGHCIIPNAEILNNLFNLPFAKYLIENDKKLKKRSTTKKY